jgi:hypothetical protein
MARRQSHADQERRLTEGRCPIHGLSMPQVDGWFIDDDGRQFTIVGCPRSDCDEHAKAYSIDGPWERLRADARAALKAPTSRRVRAVIVSDEPGTVEPIRIIIDPRTAFQISIEEADRLAHDLIAARETLTRSQ